MDGTLVTTNLVHPTLFYMKNQANPLRSFGRLAKGLLGTPQMIVAELRDRRTFNELLYALYAGVTEDRLLSLADEAFESVLRKNLYQGARDLVASCRAQGHDVVLVSGALDFLMTRLAEHLGATSVIANRLEMHDGKATGKLLRPVVAGPEKARLIREHARENEHDLDDCFAYSDSYSDVPMLSVVGHPAAVNPDSALRPAWRTRLPLARPRPGAFVLTHPCVVTLERRSSPRVFFSAAIVLVEVDLPAGTRVIYPKPPLTPLKDPDAAIRYAINHPYGSDPLHAKLKPGMKVIIAVDDISLPLPPMRARRMCVSACSRSFSRLLADHGVENIEIIIATSVHRRMTGP